MNGVEILAKHWNNQAMEGNIQADIKIPRRIRRGNIKKIRRVDVRLV